MIWYILSCAAPSHFSVLSLEELALKLPNVRNVGVVVQVCHMVFCNKLVTLSVEFLSHVELIDYLFRV